MAYLPLSTANLPDPAIDPAQGSSPEDYFNTVLYTGTGSSLDVTGVGFDPDFVWSKSRSNVTNHFLGDIVRGNDKCLFTDGTYAEATSTAYYDFITDGFNLGTGSSINASGYTYVAWNWKANGSGVSNTDGSITSTVSANTESGFSIVSYTGTGANATVGHGLDSAPEMIIGKSRDNASTGWNVYHESTGNTGILQLNATGAFYANSVYWQNTSPTNSVFTIGTQSEMNNLNEDIIAYCFHSVDGFSKFGSYTGNGSADGTFVYTGFRPAFVLIKLTSASGSEWVIFDDERNAYNLSNLHLYPNSSSSEQTAATNVLDMVSNGFKLRGSGAMVNTSGATYIYMAFAENPFKYSNAR